jgi:hypothetical protein
MPPITAHFVDQGYRPDGRWEMTASGEIGGDDLGGLESVRRFRPPVS